MSEMRAILAETSSRLLAAHCTRALQDAAEGGAFPAGLWQALEESGLARAALSEADLGDVMAVLREAGRHAAPVPLAETQLALWMLSESGIAVPPGPLAPAPVLREEPPTLRREGKGWILSGRARGVPWARDCRALAVLALHGGAPYVALAPREALDPAPGRNQAGEPRDDVTFADLPIAEGGAAKAGPGIDRETLWRRGALARIAMMAGALDTVLALTVRHAGERSQFGRAIGKFQAVQQQVSVLAAQVAAAGAAGDAAVEAAQRGDGAFEIAAAKARIGEAASEAAAIAHQVHGAMGFTREHALHLSTRRLWAWREEFGDEAYWWRRLGLAAAGAGGDGLWPALAGPGAGLGV